MLSRVGLIVVLLLLSACGGDGRRASNNPPPVSPPSISYGSAAFTYTTGIPIPIVLPRNSGGAVMTWSITPAPPAGLTFSTVDGGISGRPSAVSAAVKYLVSAGNAAGVTTAEITIVVNSGVLLDLGHDAVISLLRHNGARVLSLDAARHWALWDAQTEASVARGDAVCAECDPNAFPVNYDLADLAGPTVAIRIQEGLELRSATDGQVISTISASPSWWKLASDGSYVTVGNASGLKAWSRTGTVFLSLPGDYSHAVVYAAPTEIRVGLGSAGANVVETIATATGSSSLSPPFQGEFHSWFLDGERFFTHVLNTVWIYSKAGVEEDSKAIGSIRLLTGQGRWFWSKPGGTVAVYAVGASTVPVASYGLGQARTPMPSGSTIGFPSSTPAGFTVVDLSGASPTAVSHAITPVRVTAYAALSSSQWLLGTSDGAVIDVSPSSVPPKHYALGSSRSIAGSANRVAVATASGAIVYLDAQAKTEEGRFHFDSSNLALSTDGSVLAAQADEGFLSFQNDFALKIFSLPSGAEVNSWSYISLSSSQLPATMSLSGSGLVFGKVLDSYSGGQHTYLREVTAATGGPLIWSDVVVPGSLDSGRSLPIRLSPDGALIAVPDHAPNSSTRTTILRNATPVATIAGWPAGWIDNTRLLVNRYSSTADGVRYDGCVIVDASGQDVASIALPELLEFQTVTSDTVYSGELNSVFSLTSGDTIWSSANPSQGIGAVAGGNVVFSSGRTVRAEPLP